jgi:hypothetical protein
MKRSDIPTIEVMKAYHQYSTDRFGDFPTKILMDKFNAPEKLVYSAIQRDYDNGLIEFGVSLRTGWLTDKGVELLRANQRMIMQ